MLLSFHAGFLVILGLLFPTQAVPLKLYIRKVITLFQDPSLFFSRIDMFYRKLMSNCIATNGFQALSLDTINDTLHFSGPMTFGMNFFKDNFLLEKHMCFIFSAMNKIVMVFCLFVVFEMVFLLVLSNNHI